MKAAAQIEIKAAFQGEDAFKASAGVQAEPKATFFGEEFKAALRGEVEHLRVQLKGDMDALRIQVKEDTKSLKDETTALKVEMKNLVAMMRAMREKMSDIFAMISRQLSALQAQQGANVNANVDDPADTFIVLDSDA